MLALGTDLRDHRIIAAGECDYAGGAAVIDEQSADGHVTAIPGQPHRLCGARVVTSTSGLAMLVGRGILSGGSRAAALPLIDVSRARVVRFLRIPLDPIDVLLGPNSLSLAS
jgi:hypothetical protein